MSYLSCSAYEAITNDTRFRAISRIVGSEGAAWSIYLYFYYLAQKRYPESPGKWRFPADTLELLPELRNMVTCGYAHTDAGWVVATDKVGGAAE